MSKKKTPSEKKEAEYKRKNYISFNHGKSTRKAFRLKKRLASKKLRSKTGELTRHTLGMDCSMAATELDDVTAALIKKGLSKKRIWKSYVFSLREKVCLKTEVRESRHDRKSKNRAYDVSLWRRRLERLLADDTYSDSSIKDAREFLNARAVSSPRRWQDFLENEPMERQKLENWLNAAEKAASRRQQKRTEIDAAAIKRGTVEMLSS